MRAFILALIFMVSIILGFSQAQAQAQTQAVCPLGVKDTKLTLQRVMINFGKFTMKAEGLARVGSATDEEIAAAVSDLETAAACAQAVIDGSDEDLMPSKAHDLTGTDHEQFVAQFKQAMGMFRSALDAFAAALNRRDFADAQTQKKLVNDIADEAHSRF
jgi:hypothetical protein